MCGAATMSGVVETGSTIHNTAAQRHIPTDPPRTSTVEPHAATLFRTGKQAPDNLLEVAREWEVAQVAAEVLEEELIERAAVALAVSRRVLQVDAVAAVAAVALGAVP